MAPIANSSPIVGSAMFIEDSMKGVTNAAIEITISVTYLFVAVFMNYILSQNI